MSFAIICDARKGKELNIEFLVLVDRAKSKNFWWTSDNASIILKYEKEDAAKFAAKRLRRNNARVISYENARKIVRNQMISIQRAEDDMFEEDDDMSWDAHKSY